MESYKLSIDGLKFDNDKLDSYAAEVVANSSEKPLYVHIDNGTDWGVAFIGIASIITTALVGYLSYRIQRNQIRANACALRHHWINELRNCSSVFLQLCGHIIYSRNKVKGYFSSNEFRGDYQKALELQIKINLMVSKTSDLGRNISEDSDNLMHLLKGVSFQAGEEIHDVYDALSDLEGLIKKQLDRAWDDIKGDLGLGIKE